ncbi:UNVERIFIED_CONTAM: cysteine methyltransferase [Mumia flava]
MGVPTTSRATAYLDSPIGGLRVHSDGEHVVAIDFGATPSDDDGQDAVLVEATRQLRAYFDGDLEEFDLPLAPRGSAFQQAVWARLRAIPYGTTSTYGAIARELELGPHGARAVGAANGSNPIPVVVPCHRVIGADGTLTGYAGGLDRKQTLLSIEHAALF